MLLTFPAFTSFGKGDSVDWEFDFEVTDEEFSLMKKCYEEFDYMDICDIAELSELTDRIYKEAVRVSTEDFMSNDRDQVEDYIQDAIDSGSIESEDEWTSDMIYRIGFKWPYEIESE